MLYHKNEHSFLWMLKKMRVITMKEKTNRTESQLQRYEFIKQLNVIFHEATIEVNVDIICNKKVFQ